MILPGFAMDELLFSTPEDSLTERLESLAMQEANEGSEGVESLLEALPRELLLKIIEYAPEAVFELRLTCRLLRSLVDESAIRITTSPIVEKLKIFVSSRERLQFAPDISFYVPKENSNLFQLRLRLRQFPSQLMTLCGSSRESDRYLVYRLKFAALIEEEIVIDCLRECMGRRIEKAMLYGCDDTSAVKAVARLVEGIHFVQLNIWVNPLSEDVNNLILKSDLMNNVEQLAISVGDVQIADPVQTLIHLSSIVKSLHIEQNSVREIDPLRSYFFGQYDVDWAPIIIEMFNGKMDKLYIENYFYTGYLSSRSADLLRERLPVLGKAILFSASCSKSYVHTGYARNEHWIKATRDRHVVRRPGTPRPHSLSVKHVWRESEPFETFYPYVSAFHSMP